MTRLRSRLAAGAAISSGALLMLLTAGFAASASAPALAQEKAAAMKSVDLQLYWVRANRFIVRVEPAVRAGDKTQLQDELNALEGSLTDLRRKILSATTVGAVSSDVAAINALKVFEFQLPRVGFIVQADGAILSGEWLDALEPGMRLAIGKASERMDVSAALAGYSHLDRRSRLL